LQRCPAHGHWQIVKREDGKEPVEGALSAIPIEELPGEIAARRVRPRMQWDAVSMAST
jgi:hypothetical protein